MKAESAVFLKDVVFSFGRKSPVLDIHEFCLEAGQSVFLHGPSGCGKTTLLSVISGVLTPQSGTVRVLGQDLRALSASRRDRLRGSRIGYIFQGFNLVPYLSVAENISLPCELHAERRASMVEAALRDEVARLARRLDLERYLHEPVTKLSVGQQQRVAIARAIIGSPALLIADEPTSSLDTDRRDQFLDLLMEMTLEARDRGATTTLLFVSHDKTLAAHFDRTLSLATINRQASVSVESER